MGEAEWKAMIYGSVCSGIEAATVAWHRLGWVPEFFSEIEAFPRGVLAERWPGVPIHGDFTTITEGDYEPIELLVGGTPCQDFSVAGLRAGLAGDRGGLTIEFVHLTRRLRPRWLVWENVPGILSIDDGRAFSAFLRLLGQCGYGFAYRVLDAQHFGVPQRRRRVFVIGYLGDWRPAAAVLFESASLCGDPPPSREAGKGVAPTIAARTKGGGGLGTDFDCDGGLIARAVKAGDMGHRHDPSTDNYVVGALPAMVTPPITRNPYGDHASRDGLLIADTVRSHPRPGSNTIGNIAFGGNCQSGAIDIATVCNAKGGSGRMDFETETFVAVTHSLRADGFDASEDGTGRGTPITLAIRGRGDSHDLEYREDGVANAILTPNGGRGGIGVGAVAFNSKWSSSSGARFDSEVSPSLDIAKHDGLSIQQAMLVRRLTPRECERLQGFPDDYTLITYRGRIAADGPRYRALGNSMAVPVMRWIGERIDLIESLISR